MIGTRAGNCKLEHKKVFFAYFTNKTLLKPKDLIQELDREQRRHEELCRALSQQELRRRARSSLKTAQRRGTECPKIYRKSVMGLSQRFEL